MRDYIFVLGRDPELSILEIISYLNMVGVAWDLKKYTGDAVVFSIDEFDYFKAISRLGGSVKIGLVISEGKFKDLDVYDGTKNKVDYSISLYSESFLLKEFEKYLKSWFKKNKIKANIRKKSKNLTPRDFNRSVLDFILFDKYIAKTVAVSNPSEYKKRDKERPVNDFVRSVSIRLAKILINLSQAKETELLLDPFCGVGVVLQEAMLMDINAAGVDIDPMVARFALKNLKFTAKKYNYGIGFRVYNDDAVNLKRLFSRGSINCVASEPYLGPYFKKMPTRKEALDIVQELKTLYLRFFGALKHILRENGKVAIIMPVFKTKDGRVNLGFKSVLKQTGFKIVELHKELKFPIVYKKEKGFIDREIYVVELV